MDLSDYVASNDLGITGHKGVKNVKYYPCCEEPYPDITFVLEFTRMKK